VFDEKALKQTRLWRVLRSKEPSLVLKLWLGWSL